MPAAYGGRPVQGGAPGSPRRQRFAGLANQANTCYLNSLVQGLYATPEVRRALYSLTPEELVVEMPPDEAAPAAVGAPAPPPLSPADAAALEALTAGMGFEEAHVRRALARFPEDPDNMQRVEWLLAGGALTEDVAAPAPAEGEQPAARRNVKERRIPKELQVLFARMQAADANWQRTNRLTECFGAGFSVAVQHDVHELNRILFDRIEKQLRGTRIHELINQLYRGTVVNRIVCRSCGHRSERVEDFLDVSLVVRDFASVEASLAAFVEDELLNGDNLYECGGCKAKVEALKGVRFRELPPVLIVSLSRFEYDPQTWQRVKNARSFPFPRVLQMSPYMEDPVAHPQAPYDLFGVVIHQGAQASFGHYHTYLLDVLNESGLVGTPRAEVLGAEEAKVGDTEPLFEGWFDFNDSHVKPIASATVETQFGGKGHECAYMLVYRQREHPALMARGQPPPTLPAHLAAEIGQENAVRETQRREWDELKNTIELNVFLPAALELTKGVVRKKTATALADLSEEEDEDEADQQADQTKRLAHTHVTCTVDRRKTLGDLKAMVRTRFVADALPANLLLHRIRFMEGERVKFMRPLHRPLSTTGKEQEFDDGVVLEQLATVTHGADILAWDGVHLCDGAPFEVEYDLITVLVTRFADDGTPKLAEVQVRESSTLAELRHQLQAPLEAWQVFRWDYRRFVELEGETSTMQELHLTDHVRISVEKRRADAVDADKTWTAQHLREAEETMDVYVLNHCDDTDMKEAISCNPSMTVWDLKQAIIRKIGTLNERLPMRLRRALVGGMEGELFPDDGATLKRAGVAAHQLVIIEHGEPPDVANLTIKFTWGTATGEKLLDEMKSVCVSVATTLLDLKRRIVEDELKLSSPLASFRLRKSDFWAHQHEILADESATLKALQFRDSDCVWLEEGALPPPGTVELMLELQTSTWDSASHDEAALARNAADVYETSPLDVLHISKSAPLSELRDAVRAHPVAGPLVAGRVVRLWHKGRLLRGNPARSLKKLGIAVSSTLTLQVLPPGVETDSPLLEKETGVLLTVRQRLSDTRQYARPVETVVPAARRGQQYFVQRAELLRHLCALAGVPDTEPLVVLRLIPQSGRWKVMVDPHEAQEMMEIGVEPNKPLEGVRALQAAKEQRDRSGDLYVSDGDLVVYKVISTDPNNLDDLVAQLAYAAHMERVEYRSTGLGSWPATTTTRERAKEIALKIDDEW